MKNLIIAAVAGFTLMACTPTEPETPAVPPADAPAASPSAAADAPPPLPADPAQQPAADTCGMGQHAALIGKPASDPGVPPAGAGVRHIRPDTQVTMDYRPDRLNIDISADDVITGMRCG